MTRLRRLFSAFALLVFLLVACQPGPVPVELVTSTPSASPTKPSVPTNTPLPVSRLGVEVEALDGVTLDVWHPYFGAPSGLFESHVENFNQSNPWGILVRAQSLQNYAELFTQTGEILESENRPDVVIGLPEYALAWQEEVVDLTPYVSDPVYGLSAAEVADFPSVFWEQDQVGESRLGVPAQRTARFLLYNRTWAQELGFDAPPVNDEEFKEQACKANQSMRADSDPQNDGQGGWLVDTHPMTALSWLLAHGGGALEGDGFRFLTPENIAALRFIKGLGEEGCAWQTRNEKPLSRFVNRQALFATASLEELPDLARDFAAAGSSDRWTPLPFPGPEGSGLVVYGSSYILLGSEDAEQLAAWLFVRAMLAQDVQADWVNSQGLFPLQAGTMSLLADYKTGHPQWAEAVNLLPGATITPQLADWRTVRVALGDGFAFMFRVDTPVGQVPTILAQLDTLVTDLGK